MELSANDIKRIWAVVQGELGEEFVTLEELQLFRELMDDVVAARVLH
jgi:hypothetical protein